MPIDREIWLQPFARTHIPEWKCPSCYIGILELVDTSIKESAASRNRENWDPESASFAFSAMFQCSLKRCQEAISCCGKAHSEEIQYAVPTPGESAEGDIDREEGEVSQSELTLDFGNELFSEMGHTVGKTVFEPLFFDPALHLFDLRRYPKILKDELIASFSLFFSDSAGCANRIRTCVELLLTDRGVSRFSKSAGKRKRISLHDRIVKFSQREPVISDRLLAIKWIGNAGSHVDPIAKEDLLDAYELLDAALEDIYLKRGHRINKLTRDVNRQRGPLSGRG